jgi:predicted amidohydrolase YtcJ
LFTEDAGWTLLRKIPPPDEATKEQAILNAMDVALRSGITSVQTMLDTPEQMQVYSRLKRRLGRLPVRVVGMPPERCAEALHVHGITTGFGDEWLSLGGLKFFADGSLGARTALLSSPYADDPSTVGDRIYEPETLKHRCRAVADMGFQLVIHAIGDQAIRETLDAIEFALHDEDNRERRHRVEHASLCPPDLLQRLADRQIIATLQPQFVTSDTWTGERIGAARHAWAYPFRTMIDAGVPVGLSSDCPVEKLDAMQCLSSAVNRHPWSENDKLAVEQALRAYTVGSAYCGLREHSVGKLASGFRADFVALSDDPRQVEPTKLATVTVERVFVDGRQVRGETLNGAPAQTAPQRR